MVLVFAFAWQVIPAMSQDINETFIAGIVSDGNGDAMPYVNLFLEGSYDGDVSDTTGYFKIVTTRTGKQVLIASMIGFDRATRVLNLAGSPITDLHIIMRVKAIAMQAATITASSFSAGDDKGTTLKAMDVLTTPGAAADIFKAIKTFPGLSQIDDGSGLFVRGGDISETATILDQATVAHPYRYESPTGGAMGTITPFLVSGTFFASGGFSAKYGNVLSGVLDMQGLGRPTQKQYVFGLGLAAATAGMDMPLVDGKLGLRFSGNYSETRPMFKLNGRYSEFTRHPVGSDANLALEYDYSKTGQLRFFSYAADSRVGVKVPQPSFEGIYEGEETNQLHNVQWRELFASKWLTKTSVSLNSFDTNRSLGVYQLRQSDQTYKLRFDVERDFSSKFRVEFGAEREQLRNKFAGQYPDTDVLDPNAKKIQVDTKFTAYRTGGYFQSDIFLARGLFIKPGVRTDHYNLAGQYVVDPRASLFCQLDRDSNVRLSWGIYHQFAAPQYYQADYGNAALKAQRADHYIVGYERTFENTLLKAEIYHKKYRNLVVENDIVNFVNNGYGYARGIDLFVKQGEVIRDKLNGRVAYSFLQSKRLQVRDAETGQPEEFAPSPFDITHNLTLVLRYNVIERLAIGTQVRYATGRPITPVVGATLNEEFGFYTPIDGPVSSERLPNYTRVDANLSYLKFFKGNKYAVFYFAVSNLLNNKNVLAYDYSKDYSQRQARDTNFARFYYFGATLTLR